MYKIQPVKWQDVLHHWWQITILQYLQCCSSGAGANITNV